MKPVLLVVVFMFQQTTVNSSETIEAAVGEDVILKCNGNCTKDGKSLVLEWERNGKIVHKFRDNDDNLGLQDENFKDRTSLFYNDLRDGNFSLKLTNVTKNDGGNYSCSTDQRTFAFVTLTVTDGKGNKNQQEGEKQENAWIVMAVFIICVFVAAVVFIKWYKQKQHVPPRGCADFGYQSQAARGDDQYDEVCEIMLAPPAGGKVEDARAPSYFDGEAHLRTRPRYRIRPRSSSESSIQKSISSSESSIQKSISL